MTNWRIVFNSLNKIKDNLSCDLCMGEIKTLKDQEVEEANKALKQMYQLSVIVRDTFNLAKARFENLEGGIK